MTSQAESGEMCFSTCNRSIWLAIIGAEFTVHLINFTLQILNFFYNASLVVMLGLQPHEETNTRATI